jgi:hypothetical protein
VQCTAPTQLARHVAQVRRAIDHLDKEIGQLEAVRLRLEADLRDKV